MELSHTSATTGSPDEQRHPGERHRRLGRAGDVALTVLAAAGALCILLVLAAVLFDVTLIMFSTGSMAPTIPEGSVAVVHQIPATQSEVGDIVTVQRPDAMPITHRVVEILSTHGESVTFVMQGDANADPDPQPYTATSVRQVLVAVPGLARVIVWFQNPFVLGAITVAAAVLVTWAFWPRDEGVSARYRR